MITKITGFRATPISAVMESANEAKYFSDLEGDYTAAEVSFRQFLGGDAREPGGFFVHTPTCNNAAVCNCSFARLDCSEITSLTKTSGIRFMPDAVRMPTAGIRMPTSGIRLMTTGDAGGCFWGPNGIMTLDYLPRPPRRFCSFELV